MRLLMEAQEKNGDPKQKWAPPQVSWSMEAELLASVRDAVEKNTATLIGINLPKGKKPPQVEAYPRPTDARAVAGRKMRRQAHEELADRVLARRKKARVAGR